MQEDQPLTEEMVQQILEMRAKGRHERATRLYHAKKRGFEKGREEALKKGEKEGREKANITIVKNMLRMSFPVDIISKATGLSIEEIEKLK